MPHKVVAEQPWKSGLLEIQLTFVFCFRFFKFLLFAIVTENVDNHFLLLNRVKLPACLYIIYSSLIIITIIIQFHLIKNKLCEQSTWKNNGNGHFVRVNDGFYFFLFLVGNSKNHQDKTIVNARAHEYLRKIETDVFSFHFELNSDRI